MATHDPSTTRFVSSQMLQARRSFRAMNTDIEVTVADWRNAGQLPSVKSLFHDFEARFSRFLPESELSLFNARTAAQVRVSSSMMELLTECEWFAEVTDGVFSPLVLGALENAGYGVSFEHVSDVHELSPTTVPAPDVLRLIEPDTVELPVGLRLDFGGIGKGYCVDLASDLLHEAGHFLINAGGDIVAAGYAPGGNAWQINVDNPLSPGVPLATLLVSDKGIATSWTTKRRWRAGDGWANHLIDPRSGAPVTNDVAGVTVVAPTATEADVFAKSALILGPEAGLAFLEGQQAAGLMVMATGDRFETNDWRQYATPA